MRKYKLKLESDINQKRKNNKTNNSHNNPKVRLIQSMKYGQKMKSKSYPSQWEIRDLNQISKWCTDKK